MSMLHDLATTEIVAIPDLVPSVANKTYRSPLRYPGGKSKAVNQICNLFPKSIREYREPMIGGGSVFLAARGIGVAKTYWINDKFRELISFWRCVQVPQLCFRLQHDLEMLRSSLDSANAMRDYFLKMRATTPASEFEEALLFFFFNRVTFSGTTMAGGFSKEASLKRFTPSSIERLIPMPQALAGITITSLDYQDVVLAPGADVFIFLDPPYFRSERLFGNRGELHDFDHERLADCLNMTQHRFLLTYDDCPEIRRLYESWATIKPWSLQYGMNNCGQEKAGRVGAELFISNY